MNVADPGNYRPVREGEVVFPSDMVAFGDAFLSDVPYNPALLEKFTGYTDLSPLDVSTWADLGLNTPAYLVGTDWYNGGPWERRRHGGKWIMGFADAHVEKHGVVEWFNPKVDRIVRRWNRDHQPHPENLTQFR